ncbi:hypothetical protein SY2F82_02210 [Streptomyces sp. Y2F8-2]|uniref:hypothetical protein n=1 Tax=unclassified Streptomyces TaxID=2593676 RepID=UPI001904608C|nr:hypothetical protein [Streptomyces sp. Y2F8-2]GHJ98423.1 hypothetical protein SY2F82_02210 [Streptomyces sp. Y2F8-2]
MVRDGRDVTALRLLPWTTPEGAPCYLSTDDPGSRLSRLADELEADLLDSAEFVLTEARPLLADEATERRELRFAAVQLAAALTDALRIAASRGARLGEG